MKPNILFATLLIFSLNITIHALKGSVILDSYTFDKVLKRFKFALVKFDIPFPYGDKHEHFGQVAESFKNNDNIIIGEVGIQDFGDFENKDLADRFQLKKTDLPVVMLFRQNSFEKPEIFDTNNQFTADKIKQFVKEQTGIKIVLNNCLEEFDVLAEQFVQVQHDSQEQKMIIQNALDQSQVLDSNQQKSAEVYIKIMNKMLAEGSDFIKNEKNRIHKLLKEKMATNKKQDLEGKLNILQSFSKSTKSDHSTEL